MTQPYPPHGPGPGPQYGPGPGQQHRPGPGQQYGPGPQYGAPGAPGPKKPSLLPWLIATGVALVVVLGVLVVVLVRAGDDAPASNADATATVPSDEGLGDTDGNAVVPPDYDGPEQQGDVIPPEEPLPLDEGALNYDGSLDRATAFMDDVFLGDYPSAIGHGSQDFQAYYAGDTDLFAHEITEVSNGGTFYGYSVDSVGYDMANEADVVDISIEMEEGWMDEFLVLIGEENGQLVVVGFL
jgi:hypothetical protein